MNSLFFLLGFRCIGTLFVGFDESDYTYEMGRTVEELRVDCMVRHNMCLDKLEKTDERSYTYHCGTKEKVYIKKKVKGAKRK